MEVQYQYEGSQEELDIDENGQMNEENASPTTFKENEDDGNNIYEEKKVIPKQESRDDSFDDLGYDVPSNNDDDQFNQNPEDRTKDGIWELPLERNDCTLEEIRRGQVINKTAPNECPVLGCGKKINEMRAEPSPGTIASGLRTHVLFVHYANRKVNKKRKLCWSSKRRNQSSPKKLVGQLSSPATSLGDMDGFDPDSLSTTSGLNLIQKSVPSSQVSPPGPGSILNRKVEQIAARSHQMSSLHSLMQATGAMGQKISPPPKQSNLATNSSQNFNSTTSSLFSILAGLTQQHQPINQHQAQPQQQQQQQHNHHHQPPQQQPTSLLKPDPKPHSASNSSRNNINSNNGPVNSSLLSLLNEKISGNVASSLQSQLKKSFDSERTPQKTMPLYSFIESIATRTGSNIGPAGIMEAKKIIEKFTTSLLCSSQTIADHYLTPYVGEVPQQKPEISPSDVVLAYKMMNKSHGQP